GADYVAFGSFFPSSTKASEHRPEPDLLTWWHELMEIPCVAIGGITPQNCRPLVEAGADFLAVSQAAWGGDEAEAVRAFAVLPASRRCYSPLAASTGPIRMKPAGRPPTLRRLNHRLIRTSLVGRRWNCPMPSRAHKCSFRSCLTSKASLLA